MPLPGPPLENDQWLRDICHIPAYITKGLAGSIVMLIAPVSLSTKRIFFHVLPPSVVLNTPRSGLGANRWPRAAAYTMSGLLGSIRIQVMMCVSPRPTYCHVFPASVDLYIPPPVRTVFRGAESPVPT